MKLLWTSIALSAALTVGCTSEDDDEPAPMSAAEGPDAGTGGAEADDIDAEAPDEPDEPDAGGEPDEGDEPDEGVEPGEGEVADPDPPVVGPELLTWLQSGEYLDWPAEASVHPSDGPHFGDVRTFLNPTLADSLSANAASHPLGAASIKELYGEGAEVQGWAVMVKTDTANGNGDDWYWYEWYNNRIFADGEGAGICTGCHSGGTDFVLTSWPQ